MKKQRLVFVLLCFAVCAVYGQRAINVIPESPTTEQNCYPFGAASYWTPYMGFVYKDIEAFTLQPGDRIRFDLTQLNDVPIQRDIYIARATTNGGTVAEQWVKIVDKFEVPLNPRGNTIEGDYELSFTVSSRFVFNGGGLILAFGNSPFEDTECTNVMPGTSSADSSGKFVGRFFNQQSLVNGRSVFLEATFSTTSLAGFKLRLQEDATPPVIKTKNSTIYLDASGQATITPQDLDDGTYDSSGGLTLSIDKSTFTCTDVGLNTVVFTATDLFLNSASTTVNVTVLDDTTPTVQTKNYLLTLDSFGRATLDVSQIDNGSFDNCEIQDMFLSQTQFDCSHIGENVVTLTVRDASGNTSSSTAVVTIQDTTAPVWGTPQHVFATVSTSCTVSLAIPTPSISDNCGDFEPGNALHFDGENDFVRVPNTSELNTQNQTQRTVELFFRVEDKWSDSQKQVLWDEGNGDSGISIYLFEGTLYMGAYSKEQNWQGLNHGVWLQTTEITNGQWHQAVLVFDGTLPVEQRLKGYLDGKLFATKAVSGSQLHAHSELNSMGARLGKILFHDGHDTTTQTHNFRGDIDEVRLWTQARTAQRVAQFYTSQVNGTEQGLHVYYKIDEGVACGNNSGTKLLIDSSTHRMDGVVQGFDFSGARGCVSNFTYGSPAVLSDLTIVNSVTGTSNASSNYPVGVTEIIWTATDPSGNSSSVIQKVTVADITKPKVYTKDVVLYLSAEGTASLTPEQVDNGSRDNCEIKSRSLSKDLFTCDDLGTQLVSLRVDDVYGNMNSANATITVLDTLAPILVGKSIERTLDASGTVTITPQDVLESATDNCTVTQLSISRATFDVQDAVNSPVTIQLTAVDSSGNTTTVPVEVTIVNPAPEVRTQDIVLYLDENGEATLSPDQIDNGSTSVVGIASKTLDRTSFTCSDVGTTVVTLTITTTLGISASGTAVVTVVDAMPPKVVTQNITVDLIQGAVSITPSQIDNGSSDNCAIASLELNKTNFDCTDLGQNEVVLTVTDIHGNSASKSAIVTVQDVTNPTLITHDKTVYLDENGQVSINPEDLYTAAFDECNEPVNVSISKSEFDCTHIGLHTVIVTATDRSGNSTSQNALVTVLDVSSPNLATQDISLYLDENGSVSINTSDVVTTATDNCSVEVTLSNTQFDCSNVGPNTVTITAKDPSGNTTTETAIVTILDTTAPVLNTQDKTVRLDANGFANISISDVLTLATDNCSVSVTIDKTQFDCAALGSNVLTLTATDPSGNTATKTATVTVIDTTAPSLSTKDITLVLDTNGEGSISTSDVVVSATDNCSVEVTLNQSQFDCSNLGPNTVTITATDGSGNSTTKTATVTVQDTTPPNLITKDITTVLNANGQASITPNDVVASATDNCSVTLSLDATAFDCVDLGANTVTVTAIDPSGNVTTATALVTVVDTSAPSITPQNITLALDASGQASITANDVVAASVDNCSVTLSIDKNQFNCSDLGDSTVTITATDASGNTTIQTATVTVVDVIPPNLITQDISIALNASGQATISVTDVVTSATDNCSVTMSLDVTQFDCTDLGPNTVTITATDGSGNSTTKTATVTVQDTTPPNLITKDITIPLDANGQASITPNDVVASASDNCSVSLSIDKTQFDCSNLGQNTVTVTATDASGNSTVQEATVTIQDTTTPTLTTKDIQVSLDANGEATITANDVVASAFDNCAVDFSINKTQFNCSNLGPNTVMVTARDSSGNTVTGTAIVTVQDTTAPTISTQDIHLVLDLNGQAAIKISDVVTDASDNCLVSVSMDRTQFDCSHIGLNTVTITATDGSGNTTIQTATVTVQDSTPPNLMTKDITIPLDANGQASITVNDVVLSAVDNCSVSLSIDKTQFDCSNLGQNIVTITATDASGNSTTELATVTIQDTIAPSLVTQNIVIALDANGQVSISANDVVVSATDNCSVNVTLSKTQFDCTDVGTNIVTVTATDSAGNTTVQNVFVTVQDTTPPNLTTQNITFPLDATGEVQISLEDVSGAIQDNCNVASVSLSKALFTCADIGVNTVVITATDTSGNVSTFNTQVTIVDTIAPTVFTKNISATLTNGLVTLVPEDVDNGSFDNCDIQLSLDRTQFTCDDIGIHAVQLTATDAAGNSSTASATVEILGDVPTITISDFKAVASQRENTIFLGYGPQSVTLRTRARGGSGFTYEWTSSTGEVLDNIANPTISPVVSTTYTVTVTNSNGCTATTFIDVCVLDVRSKNKFGDPDGRILICHRTGNSFNYVTLRVNYNNVEAHLNNHGDYLGACDQQECFSSQKQPAIIPQVTVYPNPTEGQFTVKLSIMSEHTQIQLLDLFGRVLMDKKVSSFGESNEFVFNPTNLKQGMYLVKVLMDNETYTKSIVIKSSRR